MGESEHSDHCLTGDALRAACCDACRICFPPFGASPLTSENRCECLRLFNFRGFFDSTYLDNSTIFLKKTKFSKERVIPIHESLRVILERYCLTLGILHNPEAFLFPGKNPEHHYTTRQMASWFSEILRRADIDQREKGPHERGACLHCFRHLFVLKSMQQLEAAGRPVDMNDLLLPTYLGHDRLIDTDQYMRFSGLQVPEAMDAFETFTTGLIPYVEVPYEEE